VDFYLGNSFIWRDKFRANYVRAVRNEQPQELGHFVDNEDFTVTDTSTGLMWQQVTDPNRHTWLEALAYCEGASLSGYDDWRLPTVKELVSLVDRSNYGHLDTEFFPDPESVYWSSTTYFPHTSRAWIVNFFNANDGPDLKLSSHYVLAVRGGQKQLSEHLIILTPSQGSVWENDDFGTGQSMPITWETQNIPGNVEITLSRDGGKTWEIIINNTPNDGTFSWDIIGTISYNCMLKIIPLDEPTKATVQGLFSIVRGNQLGKNYGLFVGSNKGWGFFKGGYPLRGGVHARLFRQHIDQYMPIENYDNSLLEQDYENRDNVLDIANKILEIGATIDTEDTFIFYYCGHGGTNNDTLQGLVTQDSNNQIEIPPAYHFTNGISDRWLKDRLIEFPQETKKVIILDACYSGGFWDELQDVPNIAFLASTTKDTFSLPSLDLEFGSVYSTKLLEGLEPKIPGGFIAKADEDGDGHFSFYDLHDYTTDALTVLFGTYGGQELPILNWEPETGYATWESITTQFFGDDITLGTRSVGNQKPVAVAGPDRYSYADINGSGTILLSGIGSMDPDGDSLSYLWSLNGNNIGSTGTLEITLPVGIHTFELVVKDGILNSDPDYVTVRILSSADFNADGDVNLADVLLVFNSITRIDQERIISKESDVNGDGKIGLEEIIYILQKIADLR